MKYLLALLLIIPGVVYAEESIVQVPFQSHGQSCYFDEIAVEYHCTWQGNPKIITLEELESFKGVIEEQIYAQALEDLQGETLEEIAIEKAKLTPNEEQILYLEKRIERGIASNNDVALLAALKDLNLCEQGLGRTAPIQVERAFEISNDRSWLFSHVNYDGKLGVIVKAIQECHAQQTLQSVILSEQYSNMVVEDDINWHLELLKGVQAVPFDKFTTTSDHVDINSICNDFRITESHKEVLGCVIQYDGKSLKEWEMENVKRFGNEGAMEMDSEILRDYWEFRDSMSYRNQ